MKKIYDMLKPHRERVIVGTWSQEDLFLSAVKTLRYQNHTHFYAVTPYPVHGLEELMNIPRSWIPWVTFVFGLAGCAFGTWFTWWTSAVSWPLIIGGKPFWSLPAFVPIIFECTILLGAVFSVAALFYACRIPAFDPPVLDKDLTSHQFALFFYLNKSKQSSDELRNIHNTLKAEQVSLAEF